jgi:hypothetical protein
MLNISDFGNIYFRVKDLALNYNKDFHYGYIAKNGYFRNDELKMVDCTIDHITFSGKKLST